MLSKNEMLILSCFFPSLENKTTRELEIRSGLSHEPTYRILKGLVKEKCLVEKKVGKTNVYSFIKNEYSYLLFNHYSLSRKEAFLKKHKMIYSRVKEFCEEIKAESIILFGSYAKGTETEKSDIDLLAVSTKKNIEKVARTYQTKYNMVIRPVVIKPDDFKNIKKDNPEFYQDLTDFGIIIDGLEFFYKEVYQ